MKRLIVQTLICLSFFAVLFSDMTAFAAETFVLSGTMLDLDGRPVEGVELFVYDSTNVRRPADFISAKTDHSGRYRITLPSGRYWGVARKRSGDKYGPLAAGDRHSGEPVELAPVMDPELTLDFTVAELRELGRNKQRIAADFLKVSGRVLGRDGVPRLGVYVYSRTGQGGAEIPEYISAWTDVDGIYTLYLPVGRHELSVAERFPPEAPLSAGRS